MIKTASFTCNLPFEQFKSCLVDVYDEIIQHNAEKLWNTYSKDILADIDKQLAPEVSIDWNSDSDTCDLDIYANLLKQYIIETKCETQIFPEWKMAFEEYWKELMMDAINANAEKLFGKK